METQEVYSQDRLLTIDTQLEDIDSNLQKYFENYNLTQICQLLDEVDIRAASTTRDITGHQKSKNLNITGAKQRSSKIYKKQDYFQLVEICNQLWVVNGLINESAHQTQLEDKVHYYLKLRSKADEMRKEFEPVSDAGSINVFNNIDDKVKDTKQDLIELAETQLKSYLQINDNLDITFFQVVDDLQFSKFMESCHNFLGSETNILFNFNKVFNDWLQKFLDKLDEGFSASFSQNGVMSTLTLTENDVTLLKFSKSVNQMVLFFNAFIDINQSLTELKNVRLILGKSILKSFKSKIFSKENVYPLIIDKLNYDEHEDQKTSKISTVAELYKVSKALSASGWSKDGICELEFWIDDLTSSWIDNLLDYTIDELKSFTIGLMNKEKSDLFTESNLVCKELATVASPQENSIHHESEDTKKSAEDDWGDGWENNEGWNDEDDKDSDGNNSQLAKSGKSFVGEDAVTGQNEEDDDQGWGNDDSDLDLDSVDNKKSIAEDEGEDGWDAWEDEIKFDGEDDEKSNKSHGAEKPLVPSYKYSKVVDEIMLIFDNYLKNYEDLKELEVSKDQSEEAKDLFKHGFKKLCISYFMMLGNNITETYQNDILFYNDYNRILEECYNRYDVDLTTCFKMSSRFISAYNLTIYSNLSSVIEDYNKVIWNDNNLDNDIKLRAHAKEFLIRFDNEFDAINRKLSKLVSFNTQLISNIFVTVIFQYFNCICDKVLARTDISSYESEILTSIIDAIVTNTISKTKKLNLMVERIQSYNKLQQIRLILSSNLKQILEAFYDARLYEMETHELISLIESLFIESPQRTQAVVEIKSVRDAQL